MQYVIDVENKGLGPALDEFIAFLSRPDFLASYTQGKGADAYIHYGLAYTLNQTVNLPECHEDLPMADAVAPILQALPEHADKVLEIVEQFAGLNKTVGRRVYPCTHMWKNEEIPAGLDFAFALALSDAAFIPSLADYLLYTDPDHQVYQVDCIDYLVQMHGMTRDIVELIASYALHGCHGYDYAMDMIGDSPHSLTLRQAAPAQAFMARLEVIGRLSRDDFYADQIHDYRQAFAS